MQHSHGNVPGAKQKGRKRPVCLYPYVCVHACRKLHKGGEATYDYHMIAGVVLASSYKQWRIQQNNLGRARRPSRDTEQTTISNRPRTYMNIRCKNRIVYVGRVKIIFELYIPHINNEPINLKNKLATIRCRQWFRPQDRPLAMDMCKSATWYMLHRYKPC
jgi:hypothetical protein